MRTGDGQRLRAGGFTSGSEVVVQRLEAENFTVLILELNCSDYGSRANRVRWWAAIADCPPDRYKSQISSSVHETFSAIGMPPLPIEDFSLNEEGFEHRVDGAEVKRSGRRSGKKVELDYTVEHKQLYLIQNIKWPPCCSHFQLILANLDNKRREAEIVFLADSLFPETEPLKSKYLDANHSTQRTFRPQDHSDKTTLKLKARDTWREPVPTMT